MGFTSGAYSATWNNLACGQSKDGYRISHQFMKRLITGDKWGDTPQDAIVRGIDVTIEFTLIEFDGAAVQTLMNPYGTGYTAGQIGRLDVGAGGAGAFCKQLVLTALQTNPGPLPATITFPRTILHENFPVTLLQAPDLREVPIRLRAYPDLSTGAFQSA
jgi:hypothetical protein